MTFQPAIIIFFTYFGLIPISFAQTGIKGVIKNTDGEVLSFATVYVKGTTIGTTSNAAGEYFLNVPPGKQTIVAQYVGYRVQQSSVEIVEKKVLRLDFRLSEQVLQLQTVVVTNGKEDPAYRIIREAQRKRKFYRDEVNAYKADAYLKGLFRLDKRPNRILGQKITLDTGIIYLSESVSKFAYEKPDKISEQMISSKVSGNKQAFSFNQASDFNINAYDKTIDLSQERDYVSPISSQAFLLYDFEWLGSFQENGRVINKIKVIPKRSTDPAFEGIVYIVEEEWRLHSFDLMVTKQRGLEFIDSLSISQVFAPCDYDIWMPLTQKFAFRFNSFGIKGGGYYLGVYSNYEIEPDYQTYKEYGLYKAKFDAEPEKDLFEEKDFTPEVLYVEKGSNKRDAEYWETVRPIPLTSIELQDYELKDSLRIIKESRPYKDSLDRERSKPNFSSIFLTGYLHFNSVKNFYWSAPPLLNAIQFNTVEGLVPELQPTLRWKQKERTFVWVKPSLRYGFSSRHLYAKLEANYRLLDHKFTRFYAGGGSYTSQFDEKEAISPFVNSYVTLVNGQNFMKIFQKTFGYVRFQREISNGLYFTGGLEYASRDTLSNASSYSWVRQNAINYTPNQPFSYELLAEEEKSAGFASHQAFTASAKLRIRFFQKYASRPDEKFIYPSKYPEVTLIYKRAFKMVGSDLNYDFLEARIQDKMAIGQLGESNWSVAFGGFVNKNELTFVDFRHFAGNQIALSQGEEAFKFELLPFYEFSTQDVFLEAHYEHHFNEFIFNKIPLLKKLNMQAVASTNYLTTPTLGNYYEIGAGIEHIFKFLRVDYYWAYRSGDFFARGLRLGAGF